MNTILQTHILKSQTEKNRRKAYEQAVYQHLGYTQTLVNSLSTANACQIFTY